MKEWIGIQCLQDKLNQLEEQTRLLDYELINPPWYATWFVSRQEVKRNKLKWLKEYIDGIKSAIELIKNQRAP